MDDSNKSHQRSDRSPNQVLHAVEESDSVIAVIGACGFRHLGRVVEQCAELDFFAVDARSATLPFALGRARRPRRDGGDAHPAEEMRTFLQKRTSNLSCGVVGIGQKIERQLEIEALDHLDHTIEQCAPIPITQDEAFMNAPDERQGKQGASLDEERHDLPGVPHDVGRLSVAARFLMQGLHGRHPPSFFGCLDAICNEDDSSMDRNRVCSESAQYGFDPKSGEVIE